MRVSIRGNLEITNYTDEEGQKIKEHLSIDDPSYYQKIRINPRLRFSLSPEIRYYVEKEGTIFAPRGIIHWLKESFKKISFTDETITRPDPRWSLCQPIKLRENQVGIPEKTITKAQGIVNLPTGFGKSIIALEVARILGQRTLVLVPKIGIKNQFVEDAASLLGLKVGEDSPLEVQTYAWALSRLKKLPSLLENYGLVVFDECQSTVAAKTKTLFSRSPSRYRYGLSGSLDRSDGQEGAIKFFFGQVLVEVTETLLRPQVVVYQYAGGGLVDEYGKIAENLAKDKVRSEQIANLAQKGKKTLILTKRIIHFEEIEALLPPHLRRFKLYSKADNKTLLLNLRKDREEYDVILGTYSLLGTGIDIPSLDTIILAGDLKSSVLQRQSVGRVLRLFKGAKDPLVYDIADVSNPILNRHAKLRREVYEKLNWPVKICKFEKGEKQLFPESVLRLLS